MEELLAVTATLANGKTVKVNEQPIALQVDYLIANHFNAFISKEATLWRLEHLYHIMTKDGRKTLFKLNKAQKHFYENYLAAGYKKIAILKSRQLGMCLDPETKILTADLTWVKIKDINIGTEIVSVDEFPGDGRGKGRKMRLATVDKKVFNKRDAYKIYFDDGRTVVCTSQHPWLSLKTGASDTVWRSIVKRKDLNGRELGVGDKIRYITKPWGDSTLEDYWFGGILDGEGSIAKKEHSANICAAQRDGKVWERMLKYAQDNNYNYRIEIDSRKPTLDGKGKLGNSPVNKLCFRRMNETFELLGKTRPTRFIENKFWVGRELPGKKTGIGWATVTRIEKLPDQEMVDLQTSTGTYIAEGFVSHNTTLISLYFLDQVIFRPNSEALQIAHTLKDATEIFNRKIIYAIKNLPPIINSILEISQAKAARQQFSYPDGSISAIGVANSARSGTFSVGVHISELGKLAKLYQGRAEEIVTGTLPAIPVGGQAIIESTAEGASGLFHDIFMDGWKIRDTVTPALSKAHFKCVFYNWTWDVDEIEAAAQDGIIQVSEMEECEINWREYQIENSLSDNEMNFYYLKWINANKDIDKLHQEFPTHPMEAFLSSGSPYYSSRKAAQMLDRCDNNYTRYSFINGEFIQDERGDLYIYEEPKVGKNYVIGGDVAEGLLNGDYSVACVVGFDKNIKALYRGHCEPDDYKTMVEALGKKYNTALLAIEFNKDGNWVNTALRNDNYPNLYVRTTVDDITKEVTRSYGWLTNKKNRDFMLGESKKHFNSTDMINCRPLLEEILTFVRDKRGKPQASVGAHDDVVISWAIAVAVLQGRTEKEEKVKTYGLLDAIFSQ